MKETKRLIDELRELDAQFSYLGTCGEAADELTRLRAELEQERMRLVACSVVAMADTPGSAIEARKMHGDYRSASCDDVARRVDECIRLRAEVDALREALRDMHAGWQYIRSFHGDLYGVGWDRCDAKARAALKETP